jgi:hypothetical protein
MSVMNLVGHGSVAFGCTWVELMDIERASFWTVLALAYVVSLKLHSLFIDNIPLS